MTRAPYILGIGLALVCSSCRSDNPDRQYNEWLLDAFLEEAAGHEQVVLVCIYESHFQWRPLPHKHRHDLKGVVVRSYKGQWQVGDHISLWQELESAPKDWVPPVGYLTFFTLDTCTTNPIEFDVGEDWDYQPEFDRKLRFVYRAR